MARRHAHIRFGPGGLVYVVVTLLILGAAIYTQANLLFWAFGLMIGGLLVSIAVAFQVLRSVSVQRLPPSHGVVGEMLVLRYQVTNRGWLPVFGLIIHETWGRRRWLRAGWRRSGPLVERPRRLAGRPFGWILHLGPHQTLQAEAPCWPLRRGDLHFERIVLSTSFPFGVIRKVLDTEQLSQVLVYPQLFRFNRRVLFKLSQIDPAGRKRVEKAGGQEEFFGLRDYRSGDNPRMIDWKHSARMSTLIAREMTHPSPPRIMLVLDLSSVAKPVDAAAPRRGVRLSRQSLHRSTPPVEDDTFMVLNDDPVEQALSLAASLVCDAHFHGYQIGLAVMGVHAPMFPVHHSLPHRTKILEVLSTLDLTQHRSDLPPMPMPASVIIRPGLSDSSRSLDGTSIGGGVGSSGGALILGAADMRKYVTSEGTSSQLLLVNRPVRLSRREELAEA